MTLSLRPMGPILLTRGLSTASTASSSFSHRVAPWITAAAVIFGSCIAPSLSAAPPTKRYSEMTRKPDRIGSILFGSSQKARQSVPDRRSQRSTTTVSPHTYSARTSTPQPYSYGYGAVPPRTQAPAQSYAYSYPSQTPGYTVVYPQPQTPGRPSTPVPITSSYQVSPSADPRSRLSIPVTPTTTTSIPVQTAAARTLPLDATSPLDIPPPKATLAPPAPKPLPPVPDFPDYGRPVAGSRGYVHPPGNTGATYMIDVRDMAPGEKVRDPQTGLVFLVPPM